MNQIRAHRQACHMTLQELADAVGTSKAYIWQLEQKENPQPGVGLAVRIANALCAPVSSVFDVTTKEETE